MEAVLEKLKRLAVYSFATGKELDQDAKEFSTRALRLPESLRYLEDDNEDDKDLFFSSDVAEKIQRTRFDEVMLKGAQQQYGRFQKSRGNYYKNTYGGRGGYSNGRGNFFWSRPRQGVPIQSAVQRQHYSKHQLHLQLKCLTPPNTTPKKIEKTLRKTTEKHIEKNNRTSKNTKTNRNTTLLYTSARDCPRKPLAKIHIELEESDASSMALVRYQLRMPNPISIKTHPLEIETVYSVRERSNNCKFSSEFLSSISSNREVTNTGREIFVKLLHNQGTHKDTSNFGLSPYQLIRTMQSFQNGGCACIERTDRTERLPLQDRSQGCIYCSTHPSRIKEISLVQALRHDIPIPISDIWPECSPTGIFKAHEVCIGTHTCKGDPPGILLGRHMFDLLGIHYQLSKERSDSETYSRIPRVYLQHEDYEDQRATEEVDKAYVENQTDKPNFKNSIMLVVCGITREKHSHDTSNGRSTSPYSISSTRPGKESPATTIRLGNALPFVIQGMEGIEMVRNQRRKPEWTPIPKTEDTRPPAVVTHVDASDSGWGITSNEVETNEFWTEIEKETSINVRELQAILFALQLHAKRFKNSMIHIFSDNIAALKYAKKLGGTASPILQELALKIQEITAAHKLTIHYQHISGVKNVRADQLSRKTRLRYEWKLPRRFFNQIWENWGPMNVDAFATRENTRLRRFWSLQPDPQAEATDAFRQIWSKTGLYLHPPWKMIPKVIKKLKQDKIKSAVLITPNWPIQFWWPMILQQNTKLPIQLQINK
ncbi:hypothetical protein G6F56_007573 [Rhizopus delemar]|nr:hypothetical protein G6F56_007573 [Rhizopus delemar]